MRKVIDPIVYDYLVKSGAQLNNAANSGDTELAIAVMTTLVNEMPSYIKALKEG